MTTKEQRDTRPAPLVNKASAINCHYYYYYYYYHYHCLDFLPFFPTLPPTALSLTVLPPSPPPPPPPPPRERTDGVRRVTYYYWCGLPRLVKFC